jgi:hypothetical protein
LLKKVKRRIIQDLKHETLEASEMITCRILLVLTLFPPFTVYPQNQKAFTRDTEISIFRKGKKVVLFFQRAHVVFDDKGKEIVIVLSEYGKRKCQSCQHGNTKDLKPGERWGQHDYGYKEHKVTVEIKELGP